MKIDFRFAFPLEMSFLADRYQQFTDDTSQYDLFKSFMVSDYDIYKSLIFAQNHLTGRRVCPLSQTVPSDV